MIAIGLKLNVTNYNNYRSLLLTSKKWNSVSLKVMALLFSEVVYMTLWISFNLRPQIDAHKADHKLFLWPKDRWENHGYLVSSFIDVKAKLRELVKMFEKINDGAQERNAVLEDTLEVSDKFWDELQGLTQQLKALSDTIANQEPPALEPAIIREQQETLEVCWLLFCLLSRSNFMIP